MDVCVCVCVCVCGVVVVVISSVGNPHPPVLCEHGCTGAEPHLRSDRREVQLLEVRQGGEHAVAVVRLRDQRDDQPCPVNRDGHLLDCPRIMRVALSCKRTGCAAVSGHGHRAVMLNVRPSARVEQPFALASP